MPKFKNCPSRRSMFKLSSYLPFFVLCLSAGSGKSQVKISGLISDPVEGPLPGATIKVMKIDSSFVSGAQSNGEGQFTFSLSANARYILQISAISYKNIYRNIEVKDEDLVLPPINMKEDARLLSEVEIKTLQMRGEQKGDTTQFNADAYKTNPDANAEDLIKKMPGVSSDNEGLKVNGEAVQRVLVDGKPFFGDDPNAALKNLPAEIIDKVEVFDKQSDQAQFTGFSDDNQQKTINIVTKKGKNKGQFGRVYAGAGTDEDPNARYNAGASINTFSDKRRLSVLLLSNNVNQQNFSSADITGAMGTSGGGRGSRRANESLMTGGQNGISTTNAVGLNYSDEWGKNIKASGSYFFNQSENQSASNITQSYFTENRLLYKQNSESRNTNQNHRLNFRLEYDIDSANKITFVPSLSLQDNVSRSLLSGNNTILDNIFLSSTSTRSQANNLGYDLSNSLLYQHKFRKKGRTISLNLSNQLNERNNNGDYQSVNVFSDSTAGGLDQVYRLYSNTKKYSGNLSYTEPLGKSSQLQVSYLPSYSEGLSDKRTNDFDNVSNDYINFNPNLSNKYNNVYITQRGGLSYKYQKEKLNLSLGADVQESSLTGSQEFPLAFDLQQNFRNVLPNARMNYKFSKTRNLRVNYRSSTDIPNITQLQNVIDISNPLQVRSGNAELKQSFQNNLFIRYGGFDTKTSRNIMLFVNGGITDNYISNATYILRNDTVIQGLLIKSGSQLSKPVNVDGYRSARAFFVYGFPLTKIKSNVNLNTGLNYNRTPAIINNVFNYSNNYATSAGIFIGSNISEKIDFSLGYNANYTIVKNTEQKRSDNNFFTHSTSFKFNWLFLKGFVLNTDINYNRYLGLSQSFNQEYFLWNASFGYKFLKNKSLEARVSVFDILNQNRSIGRTVTGAYTEDYNTMVLRRYALFTLSYTLRNFKGGTPPKTEENADSPGGRPPVMNRPH